MRLTIILVGPARAENVGAAARAMKTMGFRELRIVDSEAHLAPPARWVAHGSGDILDGITTYPTLAEALHDVDFTVATTARSRARFHYYATPQQLLPLLEEKAQWMTHAALVFGREDSGLSNEELALRRKSQQRVSAEVQSQRIRELADKDPRVVALVIRQWMSNEL